MLTLFFCGKMIFFSTQPHWGKNPQFIQKFTFCKSHFHQNSHFQNFIFDKIHIFNVFIFHKIHIFKVLFFKKITFSEPHFLTKIHVSQTSISTEFLDKKLVFAPVCESQWNAKEINSTLPHSKFRKQAFCLRCFS